MTLPLSQAPLLRGLGSGRGPRSFFVPQERELGATSEQKDKEIHRLRVKLDQAFVPHRKGEGREDSTSPLAAEGVAGLITDATTKARDDMETRMTTQVRPCPMWTYVGHNAGSCQTRKVVGLELGCRLVCGWSGVGIQGGCGWGWGLD